MIKGLLISSAFILGSSLHAESGLTLSGPIESIKFKYEYGEDTYGVRGTPDQDMDVSASSSVPVTKDFISLFLKKGQLNLEESQSPLCGCDGSSEAYSVFLVLQAKDTVELGFNYCDEGFRTAFATIRDKDYKLTLTESEGKKVHRKFQELINRIAAIAKRKSCK